MNDSDAPVQKLDVGRVIQEMFGVIRRNLPTLAILAAMLLVVPAMVVGGLRGAVAPKSPISWQAVLLGLAAWPFALIFQGAVVYATVSDLNGKRATFAESFAVGLRNALPLLAIFILGYIATLCGMVLLLVPGLMMMTAWSVAWPAYMMDRTTIFGSFGRSAKLTRGNRWRIFGLFFVFFVAVVILEAVLGVFSQVSRITTTGQMAPLQTFLVLPLLGLVIGLIAYTGVAVLYVELRRIKDGVGAENLAAIFD